MCRILPTYLSVSAHISSYPHGLFTRRIEFLFRLSRRVMATLRLQKVLARAGVASRRAAETLIAAGRVRVDGRVVTELGTKVDARSSKVEVDGKIVLAEHLVYVVLHKPRGVVSTMSDPEGRPCVKTLLAGVPGRAYP